VKGVFFAVMVFFIMLGAMIAMLSMTYSTFVGVSKLGGVGAKGVAIVRANQQATSLQLRAERIGVQATHQSLLAMSQLTPTRRNALLTECREVEQEVVWYKNGVCAPNTSKVLRALQIDIAGRIQTYLQKEEDRFIPREYDISIIPQTKGMRVVGVPRRVALLPVNIDDSLNNKAVATVAADMGFEVEVAYDIQELLDIVTNMERVVACVEEDSPECLSNVASTLTKRTDSTEDVAFLEYQPNRIRLPEFILLRPLRFAIVSAQQ